MSLVDCCGQRSSVLDSRLVSETIRRRRRCPVCGRRWSTIEVDPRPREAPQVVQDLIKNAKKIAVEILKLEEIE